MYTNKSKYMMIGILIMFFSAFLFSMNSSQSAFLFIVGLSLFITGLTYVDKDEDDGEGETQELIEIDEQGRYKMFYNNMGYPDLCAQFPIIRPLEPRDTIAKSRPEFAADLLKTESTNNLLLGLSNSKVATIFAAHGAGVYAVSIRKKLFFGGEKIEYIIRPIMK